MKEDSDNIQRDFSEIFDIQKFDPDLLDYNLLKYHIPLLERIDVVDSGCISIFDLYQRRHVYYSPNFAAVLGWDPERALHDISYTNSLIHPDDLPGLYRAGMYFITLGFSLPVANKKDYKSIFDYRVIGREGRYVRVIEQQLPIELDSLGNVWLALSLVDLSPDTDLEAPFSGRLLNHRTGELFYFPPDEDPPRPVQVLTNREKEILGLIARGLISKQIADKLYISVNTVNTHRQRIIEKLNVSNTYEALRYAHDKGLFEG